jgi:hypothetical protein
MYSVVGDGTIKGTVIYEDRVSVPFKNLEINVSPSGCTAIVDGDIKKLDTIIINGIYTIIGAGGFENTKIFCMDEELRGVQFISLTINSLGPPYLNIEAIALPHIVTNV